MNPIVPNVGKKPGRPLKLFKKKDVIDAAQYSNFSQFVKSEYWTKIKADDMKKFLMESQVEDILSLVWKHYKVKLKKNNEQESRV